MAHSHSFSENTGQIAGIAALSAAIGAATAMLFAPRAGSDMRRAIKNRASRLRSNMDESKEDLKDSAADIKENIKETVDKKIAKK